MILITGGAGFIGSNLQAALARRGLETIVVDYLGSAGKWRNLAKHPPARLLPPSEIDAFLESHPPLEMVYHFGAVTDTTTADGDAAWATNVELSRHIWHWCTDHGVRLVYASSAATYGDGSAGFDDDPTPSALERLRPLNLYGWTKYAFDLRVARSIAGRQAHPPQWVGLKFFNVYGPNEYHKGPMRSVIAQKYPLAAAGRPVTLFRSGRPDVADGGQKRDFIYVRDCVQVVQWLLAHEVNGLFNLGTGRARSFAELAGALFSALKRPPRIEYIEAPPEVLAHYQYFTEAHMERLREVGYTPPFTTLEEGVAEYVQRYLSQPDPYL